MASAYEGEDREQDSYREARFSWSEPGQLDAIIEQAGVGIAVFTRQGFRLVAANALYQDLQTRLGVPGLTEGPGAALVGDVETPFRRVAETGESWSGGALALTDGPDAPTEYWNCTVAPLWETSADGSPSFRYLLQTLVDVTAIVRDRDGAARQAEQAARRTVEATAILDAMINGMAEAVWLSGRTGTLTRVNQHALELMGIPALPAEPVDLAWLLKQGELQHADGSPVAATDLPTWRALAGEEVQEKLRLRNARGVRFELLIRASPIRDAAGEVQGAVTMAMDLTAANVAVRAREQFLRLASHELRTPLTSMKGYAQMLLRRWQQQGQSDEREVHAVEAILRQTDRMAELVEELLDISSLETGRLELRRRRLDLNEVARRATAQMRAKTERGQLTFEGSAEPLWVSADEFRIEQVLENLIANAAKHGPPQGVVRVRAYRVEGEARVSVQDEGIGVPPRERAHLFQAFWRASNVSPNLAGLGLGLYISSEVVRRHGGRIWLEDTSGPGATFSFSLPLLSPVSDGS